MLRSVYWRSTVLLALRVALTLFIGAVALPASGQPSAADPLRLPPPAYNLPVALRDSGRPQAALAALDAELGVVTPESMPLDALLLRADLLSRADRHEESAAAWQTVMRREPALAALAHREIVEGYLAADSLERALDALSSPASAGLTPSDLLVRVAAACRSAGMLERAIGLYRTARERAGRTALADEAALGLAETLEQAGRPQAAVDVLGELQLTFRRSAAYVAATAALRRLAPPRTLTEGDYEVIADRLSSLASFRLAVEALEEWRRAFPDTIHAEEVDEAIINTLYSLRANDEARARIDAFLARYPDGPRAVAARIILFRLDVREGRTADVRARGLALWEERVEGSTAEQRQGAARLLAEYLAAVGQPSDAVEIYEQLAAQTRDPGDRMDVLWRKAVAALRAGRVTEAIRDLRRVLAMNPGSETFRATAYWLAEAESAEGSRESAARGWRQLVERYLYSYYGNRAAAKLRERLNGPADTTPTLSFPRLSLSDAVRSRADYRVAALLSRAGLLSEAATYARRLSSVFQKDNAAALLAARAAQAAGDHRSAAAIATSHFGAYFDRPAAEMPEDLWDLAYPRAYWAEIVAAAARHRVDPLLMLALARQESHFDRQARSPVGALGLFQIMPATAERIGAVLPAGAIEGVDDEHLMEAQTSAEIAARLLSDLLALFDGALAPAIASYNAGEDRVQAWWDAARGVSQDLFVDSIPYRETRGYVRQVLANYEVYRRLAGR